MTDLSKKIAVEKENIEATLFNLKTAAGKGKISVVELAGMGTFLHNIYNGIENIIKQILKSKNIRIEQSEGWHKELLDSSAKSKIISDALVDRLYEYLTFRHFFVHSYGFMLEETQLKGLIANIPEIWEQFLIEIKSYL